MALRIADREFNSRLLVGTGKYRSFQEMKRCHELSGSECVTVAVRRVNLTNRSEESLLDYIDRDKMFILPNTAGCYTADEAIRTARLGREVGLSTWVKLEVIGDEKTLFPDNEGLREATRVLAKEGFVVLPYTTDDLINARKLIDAGAAAVMPLAAAIGSGMGIQNRANLMILRELITEVPLIVDAGVGTASDAAIAMELDPPAHPLKASSPDSFAPLKAQPPTGATEPTAPRRKPGESQPLCPSPSPLGAEQLTSFPICRSASSPLEGVIAG